MVCTSYASGPTFTVTISWNASGGNAYVNYVLAYNSMNVAYNGNGVAGGGAINVCTSGPFVQTFQLPLGSGYTYKIWRAFCVRTDACNGCGSDVVIAEGGPFGVYPTPCR